MQLRLALLATLVAAMLASVGSARADDGKLVERASTEVAAYSDTDHVAVLTPSVAGHVENPTSGWSVDGSYLVDVVSAASVDIVSTASRRWSEVRQAGSLRGAYKPGAWGGSVEASASSEPDYTAYAAGGYLTRDLDEKNLVLVLGYGFGHNVIGRTGTPFSVYSHAFDQHALSAGLTALVDRRTVLTLTADFTLASGDSSKPYRYIPLFSPAVAPSVPVGATLDVVTRLRLPASVLERLPLSRDRYGIGGRLAHRFAHATARVEGTLYDDSWGLKAVSGDARVLYDLAPRWSVGPHLRYYVQSAVSFWQRAYVAGGGAVPAYRTGDRELGPLMNLTGGGTARWAIGPRSRIDAWVLGATIDATYTGFFDDLYIKRRVSALGALSLEASW